MLLTEYDCVLADAFRRASVCALHVDLQQGFYHSRMRYGLLPTSLAYHAVNHFAQDLRKYSVPNIWAAYTNKWLKSPYMEFKKEFPSDDNFSSAYSLYAGVKVLPEEFIFQKYDETAFQKYNCRLTNHFSDIGADTVLIDGVRYDQCVAETLVDAAKRRLSVYVVMDTTNCPLPYRQEFIHWIQSDMLPSDIKSKVHFVTTQSVMKCLPSLG